jgi:hypothetical protein
MADRWLDHLGDSCLAAICPVVCQTANVSPSSRTDSGGLRQFTRWPDPRCLSELLPYLSTYLGSGQPRLASQSGFTDESQYRHLDVPLYNDVRTDAIQDKLGLTYRSQVYISVSLGDGVLTLSSSIDAESLCLQTSQMSSAQWNDPLERSRRRGRDVRSSITRDVRVYSGTRSGAHRRLVESLVPRSLSAPQTHRSTVRSNGKARLQR